MTETRSALRLLTLVLMAAAVLAGCGPHQPKTTLTRAQLLERYNTNAAAVPRLWARAKIALTLTDKDGRRLSWGSTSPVVSPNGLLLMAKGDMPLGPHDFVLIGRAPAATELFRLGNSSRDGIYYLWYSLGDHSGAMWGHDELAGAPGVDMPIDPMAVLGVLTVTDLPTNPTDLPTIVLTLNTKPYEYVLTYVDRRPVTGEILFHREIHCTWSDSKPPRPFLVNLFDAEGHKVMAASLGNYKAIDVPDSSGGAGPVMPTDIQITWPAKNSRLHMVLSEMTTAEKWDRSQALFTPNMPRSIPLDEVVQVDKALGSGGAAE